MLSLTFRVICVLCFFKTMEYISIGEAVLSVSCSQTLMIAVRSLPRDQLGLLQCWNPCLGRRLASWSSGFSSTWVYLKGSSLAFFSTQEIGQCRFIP